jgi:hypothetical protein
MMTEGEYNGDGNTDVVFIVGSCCCRGSDPVGETICEFLKTIIWTWYLIDTYG